MDPENVTSALGISNQTSSNIFISPDRFNTSQPHQGEPLWTSSSTPDLDSTGVDVFVSTSVHPGYQDWLSQDVLTSKSHYTDAVSHLTTWPVVMDDEFYDLSHVTYPLPPKTVPIAEAVLKVVFCVLIMSVAVFGNCAVILTVWKKKRLQSTTNYYIVNLAVSDLLVTGSCTWVQVVHSLTEGWQLGALFCKFNSFAQVLSLVSSILTLTLISCDRFFGIMCAMRAHLVERRAYIFIVLVWILSIGVSAPILVYRRQYTRVWADHVEIWCADSWPLSADGSGTGVARRTYYTLVSLVLFFIPIAIMSVAYLLIIYKLWSRMPPGEMIDCDVTAQVRVKRKVILMLITILSVFAICWLPLQVSILYAEHRPNVNHSELPVWYEDFTYFATFLAYSNSAINPIIYTCFNENYRKAFKEVFNCGKRNHPHMNGHRYSYNSVEMRTQQERQTEVTCTQILHSPNLPKKNDVLATL